MKNERGSALITVILVVLVLTMVGLAALVFMSVEDRISGNDRLQKEALYSAEAGLRQGERQLAQLLTGGRQVTTLLAHVSTASTAAASPAVPVVPAGTPALYDLAHLGTYLMDSTTSADLANQPVGYTNTSGATIGNRAFYSLYIRNNEDDINGDPVSDQDGKFDLISVGWIQASNGRIIAVKILGEGFNVGSTFNVGAQKGMNQGGTNSPN